jgi:hypothetical protein
LLLGDVGNRIASKPPVQCPLWVRELPDDTRLEDRLVDEHTKRELARNVVSAYEDLEESELSG